MMNKTIQKPANWQDFETLCKKLWGEVWGIPLKIKKNGRSGQPQAGVDVYGIPKGESNYWGIQCKGKDDYSGAKLTKGEIDDEIEKARGFKPELDVFIFATTMNKDSDIEEYVRLKDVESRNKGEFEILLFCWEDIADLIDDNQDTYNFYVANKQHKTKFEFQVSLNEFVQEHVIRPKCVKTIRKYMLKKTKEELESSLSGVFPDMSWMKNMNFGATSVTTQKINSAICSFEVIMENIGGTVIEDWRVELTVKGAYSKIMDQLGTGPMGMLDLAELKNKLTYIDGERITYSPRLNEPLIQKDNRFFKAYIIPECKEYSIPIEWRLLARDFSSEGIITLRVEPIYEEEFIYEYVDTKEELKEDELVSINEKKNY